MACVRAVVATALCLVVAVLASAHNPDSLQSRPAAVSATAQTYEPIPELDETNKADHSQAHEKQQQQQQQQQAVPTTSPSSTAETSARSAAGAVHVSADGLAVPHEDLAAASPEARHSSAEKVRQSSDGDAVVPPQSEDSMKSQSADPSPAVEDKTSQGNDNVPPQKNNMQDDDQEATHLGQRLVRMVAQSLGWDQSSMTSKSEGKSTTASEDADASADATAPHSEGQSNSEEPAQGKSTFEDWVPKAVLDAASNIRGLLKTSPGNHDQETSTNTRTSSSSASSSSSSQSSARSRAASFASAWLASTQAATASLSSAAMNAWNTVTDSLPVADLVEYLPSSVVSGTSAQEDSPSRKPRARSNVILVAAIVSVSTLLLQSIVSWLFSSSNSLRSRRPTKGESCSWLNVWRQFHSDEIISLGLFSSTKFRHALLKRINDELANAQHGARNPPKIRVTHIGELPSIPHINSVRCYNKNLPMGDGSVDELLQHQTGADSEQNVVLEASITFEATTDARLDLIASVYPASTITCHIKRFTATVQIWVVAGMVTMTLPKNPKLTLRCTGKQKLQYKMLETHISSAIKHAFTNPRTIRWFHGRGQEDDVNDKPRWASVPRIVLDNADASQTLQTNALNVKVVRATDLPQMPDQQIDPYCVVELDSPQMRHRTVTVANTAYPEFGDQMHFDVSPNSRMLLINVYDGSNSKMAGAFLGRGTVDIRQLQLGEHRSLQVPLVTLVGSQEITKGSVELDVELCNADAAPRRARRVSRDGFASWNQALARRNDQAPSPLQQGQELELEPPSPNGGLDVQQPPLRAGSASVRMFEEASRFSTIDGLSPITPTSPERLGEEQLLVHDRLHSEPGEVEPAQPHSVSRYVQSLAAAPDETQSVSNFSSRTDITGISALSALPRLSRGFVVAETKHTYGTHWSLQGSTSSTKESLTASWHGKTRKLLVLCGHAFQLQRGVKHQSACALCRQKFSKFGSGSSVLCCIGCRGCVHKKCVEKIRERCPNPYLPDLSAPSIGQQTSVTGALRTQLHSTTIGPLNASM